MGTLGAVRFLPAQESRVWGTTTDLGFFRGVSGDRFLDRPATHFCQQYYSSPGRGLSNGPQGSARRRTRPGRRRPKEARFGGFRNAGNGPFLRPGGGSGAGRKLGGCTGERAFIRDSHQPTGGGWTGRGAPKLVSGPISILSPVPRGAPTTSPNAPPPFFWPGWRAHPPTSPRPPPPPYPSFKGGVPGAARGGR